MNREFGNVKKFTCPSEFFLLKILWSLFRRREKNVQFSHKKSNSLLLPANQHVDDRRVHKYNYFSAIDAIVNGSFDGVKFRFGNIVYSIRPRAVKIQII